MVVAVLLRVVVGLLAVGNSLAREDATSAPLHLSTEIPAVDDYVVLADPLSGALERLETTLRSNRARTRAAQPIGLEPVAEFPPQTKPLAREGLFGARVMVRIRGVSLQELETALGSANPGIYAIGPNAEITGAELETRHWNLDRVDQTEGLDGRYVPSEELGRGVDIYIVDSGVSPWHVSFGSRVERGVGTVGEGDYGDMDCSGHGTHVASTAAGSGYGIASEAQIIPVRMLDCRSKGSVATLAAAVSWVVSSIRSREMTRRAVVNLSLQSSANPAIDSLVEMLLSAGAVVISAAGNSGTDACHFSPARVRGGLTVGSSSADDSVSTWSNRGSCVDLYAPGEDVIGASIESVSAERSRSGTSMSTPIVSGIAATLLERHPFLPAAEIMSLVLRQATQFPVPAFDLDCSGSLAGQLLAQALRGPLPGSVRVQGDSDKGRFVRWHPDWRFSHTLRFSAKTLRPQRRGPRFDVMLAKRPMPGGSSLFESASLACRDISQRWYRIRLRDGVLLAEDFQGNLLAKAGPLSTDTSDFSLAVERAGPGGVVIRVYAGEQELMVATDTNYVGEVASLQWVSFGADVGEEIEYTVRQIHTQAPTPQVSAGPAASPHGKLKVTRKHVGKYVKWPLAWRRDVASGPSCFQFSTTPLSNGVVFVAMANVPLGQIRAAASQWKANAPKKAIGHVVVMSRERVSLFRNGQLLHRTELEPPLDIPPNLGGLVVRMYGHGDGRFEVVTGPEFATDRRVVFNATDALQSAGERFSLTSSFVTQFWDIGLC